MIAATSPALTEKVEAVRILLAVDLSVEIGDFKHVTSLPIDAGPIVGLWHRLHLQ